MKKLFLILILLIAFNGQAFADATTTSTLTPKSGKIDFMSGGAVAVTDQSTGYTQRVDSNGSAKVMEKSKAISAVTGATLLAGSNVYAGACRVNTVTMSGASSAAGDYLLVYDALTATGTPKIEISLGTAKDTKEVVIPGGADFSTGIFVVSNSAGPHASITYDY